MKDKDEIVAQGYQLTNEQKKRIWRVYQDLMDYVEHFMIMRNNAFSFQLTVFFNSIIIGFIICVNNHIQLPFPHFLGASIVLFTGVLLYLSFFNSSFFAQRRCQLGVIQVACEMLKKYPLTLRNRSSKIYYSSGSVLPELILFAVLLFTAVLALSIWISPSEHITILVNIFSVLIIILICVWISYRVHRDDDLVVSWDASLLLDISEEEFEETWAIQSNYIKRLKFINSSLGGIKKTLITFAIISPLIILGDLLLKNFELSKSAIPIYGFAVSFLAQAPILSIWYYYMLKTQRNAQTIFNESLEFEKNYPYLPPIWRSMLIKASPQSVVFHMSASYIVALISLLFLGLSFIFFSDLDFIFKLLLVLFSCFVCFVSSTYILKQSWPK